MKKLMLILFLSLFLISFASAISSNANAITYTTNSTLIESRGFNITIKENTASIVVQKITSSNATKAWLYDISGNYLANGTFSGNNATITYNFVNGTTYGVFVDSGGSAYVDTYAGGLTFPITNSTVTWINGLYLSTFGDGTAKSLTIDAGFGHSITNIWTFGQDVILNLVAPTNGLSISNTDTNFTAQFNMSGTNFSYQWKNATYYIWKSNGTLFNQTLRTLTGNNTQYSQVFNNFDLGSYVWNVRACYANATFSNCTLAASNFSFTVLPFSINAITYNTSVLETSTQNFFINISAIATVSSVTGRFWYNGTSRTANVTDGTTGLYKSNDTIDIPLQDASGNMSFYWQFDFLLNDSSTLQQNTSVYSQEVNRTVLVFCNSTYPVKFLNFTTKSAENPFPNLNSTFKSAFNWWLGSGNVSRNYSYEDISETKQNYTFCMNYNTTFYVDSHIEYDATNYALNTYYLENASISNVTNNISLFLLNDSKATVTTLKVRDEIQNPKSNILLYIQLYDVGTDAYHTVAMAKTSFAGQDIAYLNWYDSLYKFILVENGNIIKVVDPYRISSTPQIFDINTTIAFDFDKFRNFQYTLYYNNVTQNFVLTFVKPSGLVDQGCLRVSKINASSETQLALLCESSSSATLYYNIASAGNGTFVATFYATGSYALIDRITQVIGGSFARDINTLLGTNDSTAYAFLFAGIVVTMFAITPVLGVVGLILGLLGAAGLGFVVMDYMVFSGVIIVGGIIIWLIKR